MDKPKTECNFWEPDGYPSESLSDGPLDEEMPEGSDTIDFDVNQIPGFPQSMKDAIARVYAYQSDNPEGEAAITVKLRFPEGYVKSSITVSLPHNIKMDLEDATVIRENGTIRLEAMIQTTIFDQAGHNR